MRLTIAILALLSGTAAAARDLPVAIAAGKPENCIQLNQIRDTYVRDDRTIDFVMSGRKTYRNTLPYECSNLGFEQRFTYETSLNELCSTDIITVLYAGAGPLRGASCGLGQFQPVTLTSR